MPIVAPELSADVETAFLIALMLLVLVLQVWDQATHRCYYYGHKFRHLENTWRCARCACPHPAAREYGPYD